MSDKLDFRKLGPFKIDKKISDTNYRLSLPDTMRIHPTFHVSLLEPAPHGTETQDTIEVDPEQEYEVERIIGKRHKHGKTEWLVKWKGYGDTENTWEPDENLTNCEELIRQYDPTAWVRHYR